MNEVSYGFSEKAMKTTNKVEGNLLDYSLFTGRACAQALPSQNSHRFCGKPLGGVIYSNHPLNEDRPIRKWIALR